MKVSCLGLVVLVYGVYYLTLYPSVPGGDSGELLAEACQLGVAHPPGYPTFTMLNHAVMKYVQLPPRFYLDNQWNLHHDPSPTKAYFANHLSAVFGSFTVLFMATTVDEVLETVLGSFFPLRYFPVLLYAFSPIIWEYSVTAEVFALNNFLCSWILLLSVKIFKLCFSARKEFAEDEGKVRGLLYFGAFLSGLALSNQHTSLLHVSYLILWIIGLLVYFKPVKNLLFALVITGICFVLGLTPYAYLFFASQRSPEGSWGDTSSLSGLIRHVLRSEYGTFRLGGIVGSENWWERIVLYGKFVSKDSYYLVFPVILAGVALLVISYLKQTRPGQNSKKKPVVAVPTQKNKNKSDNNKSTKKNARIEEEDPTLVSTSPSFDSSTSFTSTPTFFLFFWLLSLWLFYTLVWHYVFSNLPLSAPMPFGVHARFWMQPSIPLFVLMGVSVQLILNRLFDSPSKGNQLTENVVEPSMMVLLISLLLYSRLPTNNRSVYGWMIHKYAEASLKSILSSEGSDGTNSLLLSHTDIDLNSMRYLRVCEGFNSLNTSSGSLEHYSTQMMPYPWFSTKQKPYFKQFQLPDLEFPGVSTDKKSAGNKVLITRLLEGNGVVKKEQKQSKKSKKNDKQADLSVNERFSGGVYLDMQAISDLDIGDMSIWRGLDLGDKAADQHEFVLVPWGSQYRVFPHDSANISFIEDFHRSSYQKIREFQKSLIFSDEILLSGFASFSSSATDQPIERKESNLFHQVFPLGTWESAVVNIYYDMMNQFGLSLLTYSMTQQQVKGMTMDRLPILLDRLMVAIDFLEHCFEDVSRISTLSSSVRDLHKNTALAFMRFHALLSVIHQNQFRENFVRIYEMQRQQKKPYFLNEENFERQVLSPNAFTRCLQRSLSFIQGFISKYPDDKDFQVFQSIAIKIQQELN